MKTKTLLSTFMVLGALTAAPIYETSATGELSGSRVNADLVLGGNYPSRNLSVSWNIADLGSGNWSYEYTFAGFTRPAISHVILELSDACGATGCLSDIEYAGGVSTEFKEHGVSPGNPGFPAGFSFYGVKFDGTNADNLVISFVANKAPVYGHFYLKGGNTSFAYNKGLTNEASANVRDFIARPDTFGNPVPEPGSIGLMAAGLAMAALRLRRR